MHLSSLCRNISYSNEKNTKNTVEYCLRKTSIYIILETPEIFHSLRRAQVVLKTVFFPLVCGNWTCPDFTKCNSIAILSRYQTECEYSYCIFQYMFVSAKQIYCCRLRAVSVTVTVTFSL